LDKQHDIVPVGSVTIFGKTHIAQK
jgi:hypothetical protein